MRSGGGRVDLDSASSSSASKVKVEIVEGSFDDIGEPLSKRPRITKAMEQVCGVRQIAFQVTPTPTPYNPLDEPSPLGLTLRKTPSLLELIQKRLSQDNAIAPEDQKGESHCGSGAKKEGKHNSSAGTVDKLKASNFPGSMLRIGSWEYKSRYEGDLVAKCYFAKHKLVWEILDGGLKSKVEIQWSDITALKARCPDNDPGTLDVVLARQPLFFRETNPQPRKHTLWQATADFTNGQASIHRQHFLQCPPGLLNKHFEKLIQCDVHLNFLSRQPERILDTPYFEQRPVFEDSIDLKVQVENGKASSVISAFKDLSSPSAARSSSFENDKGDIVGSSSEHVSHEPLSPCSAIESENCETVDSKMSRSWDQIKVPGLQPSMSMSDLMNHLGSCLTSQKSAGNLTLPSELSSGCKEILEDMTQYLLNDNQQTTSSDEKRLMARVNSLCCLLQKEPGTNQNLQALGGSYDDDKGTHLNQSFESSPINYKNKGDTNYMEDCSKPVTGMSRKDSFGELLLHLPRIASLPKFLFNISEDDGETQAR